MWSTDYKFSTPFKYFKLILIFMYNNPSESNKKANYRHTSL